MTRGERVHTRTARIPALLLILFLGAPAAAIDPSLCGDDGVTEVPDFSMGRDGNQCLMIDPGNGDAPVPFQYETFHKTGISVGCDSPQNPGVERIEHNMDTYGRCPTQFNGQYCSQIFWDVTWDNYLDPACRNEDGLFFSGGMGLELLYFKNSKILNTWKCAGGNWTGPNGLRCNGEDSNAHTDGIQMRNMPSNGGWVIYQDVTFLNGRNLHYLHQGAAKYGAHGNILFQGTHWGRTTSPVGEATNWVADCKARGGNDDICERGRSSIGYPAQEVWVIDTYGTTPFNLKALYDKIVVVNTGCGTNGCGGEIQFDDGWPHPMGGSGNGPGTCPNGQIPKECGGGSNNGTCYCYTSLENALSDTSCPDCPHKAPPFVHLSAAGWENPPPGAGASRPIPPDFLPEQ